MASITDQSKKITTIDIDLSTLGFIDNGANITTANISSLVDAGKKVIILPLSKTLGMNSNESFIIEDISFNKTKDSATITSSAVTNAIKVQRVIATAGLNTKKPTITSGQNETVASLVADATTVSLLNIRPATRKELASVSGSLSAGSVGVRDTDAGDNFTTGGALVIYADAANSHFSTAALVGKLNISISYKKVPR